MWLINATQNIQNYQTLTSHILSIFILILSIQAYAQMPLYFYRADTVKVKSGASYLTNPWAGGFNNPQFSEIDLNFDGIKDLFVFDRSGNKISTFINNGTVGSTDYVHAPEYQNAFPLMNDWAFLQDYNCDGKEDIFTHNGGAMEVYRNDGNIIDGLKFTLVVSSLLSDYLTDTIPITVSAIDLPAISDIDGDGDLDVLNFRTSSIYVEYHKNRSMELYGTCDSLDFKINANCWGYFSENSISNDVNLNDTCSDDISPHLLPQGGSENSKSVDESNLSNLDLKADEPKVLSFGEDLGEAHSGSTLLAIDLDGDSDKDLLVGDLSFNNMVMLENGGDNQNAYISLQESNFPSYSTPVNLTVFPAAFNLDVNNDGANDLLVSPNAANISDNTNSVWYYKNTGTTSIPNFILEQKNIFQDEMIELGEGAYPVFFDYNSDGLLDLLIGNYGYYNNTGSYQSGLALYENTGSLTNPEFEFISADYADIISLGLQNVIPTFGDMDNDGDDDMIIGNKDGALHYFKNSAGAGNNPNFTLTEPFYQGIDVGNFSAPFIADMNNDGKPDLIIGEQNGNLNYMENTGTAALPVFTTNNSFWGQVDVRQSGSILGYSIPCIYKINGESNLFVGSEAGDVYHYTNIDNNLTGTFTLNDSTIGNIYEGTRCGVTASDLNNDGLCDLATGNYDGGVALFYGSNTDGIKNSSHHIYSEIKRFFPNPANDIVTIEFNDKIHFSCLKIYDRLGKEIEDFNICNKISVHINTTQYSDGLYFMVISGENKCESHKLSVIH